MRSYSNSTMVDPHIGPTNVIQHESKILLVWHIICIQALPMVVQIVKRKSMSHGQATTAWGTDYRSTIHLYSLARFDWEDAVRRRLAAKLTAHGFWSQDFPKAVKPPSRSLKWLTHVSSLWLMCDADKLAIVNLNVLPWILPVAVPLKCIAKWYNYTGWIRRDSPGMPNEVRGSHLWH